MGKSMFILYDGRAKCGECDDAGVMDTADTEDEARESGSEDWAEYDAIWYEHECLTEPTKGKPGELGPGQPRWDLPPAREFDHERPPKATHPKGYVGRQVQPLTPEERTAKNRRKRHRYRANVKAKKLAAQSTEKP